MLSVAVFYGLNTKFGSIPPIGKFLDPAQGIWQNDKTETNEISELQIKGLAEGVTIHYDENLIPHIFAENDTDLYFTQGYITAKHRLWQMEFQTHAAAGRISELIGDAAIDFDKLQRRQGMVLGAENALAKMNEDPETAQYIEAYKNGINQYIEKLSPSDYPIEYKLLDYRPEQWTTKKTALLLMYMTDMLAGGDSDLEYTNFLKKYGKDRFDLLYPDFFDIIDPIIPKERDWSEWEVVSHEIPAGELPMDSIAHTMDKPDPDNGSNNWAVAPVKSFSGNAILANDPHLGLKLPSIWYAMQLATPEKNTLGVSLPGALGIIIGFNNDISWGVTNATRDVKDWYKISFEDHSRNTYHHDGKLLPTTKRIEEIKIRGKKSVFDTVVYTHHGPVSYDINFKGDNQKEGYAMKWTGHIGGNNQRTFLELNKAKNYDEYTQAIKHHIAPAQNFIFASVTGDIAIWIQGKFPNKWKGQGKFLMDGSNPDHDWNGFIPQKHNAHIKNPERGFVSSANQHPTDPSYPYYVFNDGYDTYRSRVINNFFRSKEKFDIQDFKDLQNNNYNLKAAELLPHMLENIDFSNLSSEEMELLNELKNWDFYNDIDQNGPSIWEAWWNKLVPLTWDELNVEDVAFEYPFQYQTSYLLKNNPDDAFMDVIDTPEKETAKDLFFISFKAAASDLIEWKTKNGAYNWGDYKATFVGHLLQALPAFSRFNLPIGGNGGTVNATKKDHGPSWRMIVEMSSPPKALGIYPGGQSGNPGSKYYDDFIDIWASGDYLELDFMRDKDQTKGVLFTQTLNPE